MSAGFDWSTWGDLISAVLGAIVGWFSRHFGFPVGGDGKGDGK